MIDYKQHLFTLETGADIEGAIITKEGLQQLLQVLKGLQSEIENIKADKLQSPIIGVHFCYFIDDIETIVANKQIGGNHNPVLEILDLKKSGNETEKVSRIVEHLEKLGLRTKK